MNGLLRLISLSTDKPYWETTTPFAHVSNVLGISPLLHFHDSVVVFHVFSVCCCLCQESRQHRALGHPGMHGQQTLWKTEAQHMYTQHIAHIPCMYVTTDSSEEESTHTGHKVLVLVAWYISLQAHKSVHKTLPWHIAMTNVSVLGSIQIWSHVLCMHIVILSQSIKDYIAHTSIACRVC